MRWLRRVRLVDPPRDAVHPDFPEADFTQVDIDGDGLLNDDEMALAYGSGILPAEN